MQLIILGFFVAFFSASIGVGGGAILVPTLVSAFKYDYRSAAGTSLATIIPISFVGAISHSILLQKIPDLHYFLLFIPTCIIFAVLGGYFVKKIENRYLKITFGIFLLFVSLKMLGIDNLPFLILQNISTYILPDKLFLLIVFGAIVGLVSVLLGVGCGLVIVPFYVIIIGFEIHEAVMLSLTTMFFLTFTGALIHKKHKILNIASAKKIFVPALIGAICGAFFGNYMPASVLKMIFAIFLLLMALKYIIEECIVYIRKIAQWMIYENKEY